jgi:hypothetical protein
VQAAIAAKQQRLVQHAEVTAERVLEELRRLAFLDPARFYYPPGHERAGQLMPTEEMDETSAPASRARGWRARTWTALTGSGTRAGSTS